MTEDCGSWEYTCKCGEEKKLPGDWVEWECTSCNHKEYNPKNNINRNMIKAWTIIGWGLSLIAYIISKTFHTSVIFENISMFISFWFLFIFLLLSIKG